MKTQLVAEIGINHNGDLDIAKKLIDSACLGGCKFVKFQKRDIELVYTKDELDKYRESPWGTTNREQKLGLEFNKTQYDEIDRYCKEKGIQWFASPWDVNSVKFLQQYTMPYIKVAAACMCNFSLLEEIKGTGIPVIVSTGMLSKEELDKSLAVLGGSVTDILSCTSTYPTNTNDININKIKTLKEIYGSKYRVGFSNHYQGLTFIFMAYTLGAEMIEYHITLDRSMYGSDQAASIEVPGVIRIGATIKDMECAWGDGEIKCLHSEEPIRNKLMIKK